jgi:antirestriction protein
MQELHPRIYVACLAAYNNGQLHGAWIDADQSADAIHDEIRAMLASSPISGAEEWAIHDYEDFGGIQLSEYEGIDRVAEIAALLVEHGEAFGVWADYYGNAVSAEEFRDAYRGEYESEEAYAEEFIADVGMLDSIPENLRYYFDHERFARDMFASDMHSVRSGHGTVYVFARNV